MVAMGRALGTRPARGSRRGARRDEVLDRIADSGEAVFAVDGSDKIVLWNAACEKLLGTPAAAALGRPCYQIVCGRDVYGNVFCYRSCPISYQVRERQEPVRRFSMVVGNGGKPRTLQVSTFVIPAVRSSSSTIVHVLQQDGSPASPLELDLEAAADRKPEPRRHLRTPGGDTIELTVREREILRRLAEGLPTRGIANSLFISPVTVRNHVANILTKLDVHTKLAAVAFAFRNGLV